MAKGSLILAAAAALGAVVWMWPSDAVTPPSKPLRSEQDAINEFSAPAIARVEVKLPEPAPSPEPVKHAEEKVSHKPPEPRPEWINDDKFVEAGLTREQAAELTEGMRILHEGKYTFGEDPKRPRNEAVLAGLFMLELGPTLADRIKDGAISVRWLPRVRPWPQFAGNSFALDMSPGSAEPLSYTAHGRVGFVSLEIPRKLWNQELLALVVAAGEAK